MALAINNNIFSLHLNAGALAELNKADSRLATEGAKINSSDTEESTLTTNNREDLLSKMKDDFYLPPEALAKPNLEGDPPTEIAPIIDSSVISQMMQRPIDMSALEKFKSLQLYYGISCDATRIESGVNDLAAAQQTGTAMYNNALSNQAAVMSGVGRGTSPATIQSGVGRGVELASVQSGVGRGTSPATIQSGVGRGASLQNLGGERGNSALLAQNYNQLMNVDLNNAAATSAQNSTAPQSVLRLF